MTWLRPSPFVVLAASILTACAQAATETTHLQADDLKIARGVPFDPNELVESAAFADGQGLGAVDVQQLLAKTPYGRASFLATYSSNGVRADDAILRAAAKYRLNPLVFIVRAEMSEGLVGEQFYPAPPARVEYVFRCGCSSATTCDPALAGFDVQVDCLGNALRTSLDAIAAGGTTAGGWGPGVTSTAVDGEKVTPADESTAALYQYDPKVGTGSSGAWLFWNIWQEYAGAANYVPPTAR